MFKSNADSILKIVSTERLKGNYELAYQNLLCLLNDYDKQNGQNKQIIKDEQKIYNFNIWDELGSIAFYVSKKDDGRFAFSKLIELAEKNVPETIEGLRNNGDRILRNMAYYDCPELCTKFSKILDNIKTSVIQDNDYISFSKILDNAKASAVNKDNDDNIKSTKSREEQIDFINSVLDIYCINLKRCPERWQRCEEEFNKHGLQVKRFEAIDGNTISFEDLLKKNMVTANLDPIVKKQKGNLGGIASVVELWNQISKNDTNKWTLILEDDVKFHPNFLELFEKYWPNVPKSADVILFGFHYPWFCDPYDEKVLSNVCININKYVVKFHTSVNGYHAFAINKRSALKLLNDYVPVSTAIDKLSPDKFNIYGFKRPQGTDKSLIDNMYIDYALWEGHHNVSMYGLVGTRSEKSTIGHYKYQCLWFVDNEYNQKNYEKAYQHIKTMLEDLSIYDADTVNFTIWYKIIAIGYHIDKREEGIDAIKELIKRKDISETINGIKKNKVHLLECISHYNVPEVMEEIIFFFNY